MFGPYLKIIEHMGFDLMIFIFMFCLTIFTLACFGALFFPSIYPNLYYSFMNLFSLSASYIGAESFEQYADTQYELWFCIIYEFISILATTYMLYNLACAIILKTWSKLESKTLALYNYEVISILQEHTYDKYYFCLISSHVPITFIILLFSPFFAFVRDKRKLKKLNKFLVMLCYVPIPLTVTPFYILTNVLMSPLAYI